MNKDYESLVLDIQRSGEEGVGLDEAEKLAGKALFIMNGLSEELAKADKDRRMRKRGLKAIKSAVRLEEIKKYDKKPTEGALDDAVNMNEIVAGEEESFDNAEVATEALDRQFGIAKEAHIYFRSVSKGRFE